ncbi:MAG: IS21-like element helper ATPase IstB [Actinomycetota bacterium]
MLSHLTIDKLQALNLGAMATGLADQMAAPSVFSELGFEERLGLLVDTEADARESRSLARRLKAAKLHYPAAIEDIDWRSPRGLERSTIASLAQSGWVKAQHNLVVTGPTGVGKSYLACALANAALRAGHTVTYVRVPRMIDDLAVGRADGRYPRMLAALGRVSLLVLDDFLLTPAPVQACRELLEVIEERAQRGSILVASQLPVDAWHTAMADSTLAEAILDRILHSAHRIELTGRSLRQTQPELPTDPADATPAKG